MTVLCPDCRGSVGENLRMSCSSCGWRPTEIGGLHYMLRSREMEDRNKDAYAENYDQLAQRNLRKSNINRRYLRVQAQNILRYIGTVKGKTVCDLGVGQGFMTAEFLAAGAKQVTGLDISETYLADLEERSNLDRIVANAENIPFYEEFDVLTSTDVMEHVIDLGSFLYGVSQAVKPNGIVCIRVPYMKTVVHHSQFLGYPHEYGHLRSFDQKVLIMLMETAGFSPVRIHYDGFSLQMPNSFFGRGTLRQGLYGAFQRVVQSWLEDVNDVARWNSRVATLFMMRNEIVVVARKVARIAKVEPQGYLLVPLAGRL